MNKREQAAFDRGGLNYFEGKDTNPYHDPKLKAAWEKGYQVGIEKGKQWTEVFGKLHEAGILMPVIIIDPEDEASITRAGQQIASEIKIRFNNRQN